MVIIGQRFSPLGSGPSFGEGQVTYSDISPEEWEQKLKRQGMPEHLTGHLLAMGELHRAGRYDRQADGVERVTGRPAMSVGEFVSLHAEEFGGRRS